MLLSWPIVFLALAEVVPFHLVTPFVTLALIDPVRVLLKKNVYALFYVASHFNFWLPFIGNLVFMASMIVSFDYAFESFMYGTAFAMMMTNCLAGDADLSKRTVTSRHGILLYTIFVVLLIVFVLLLLAGTMPRARNRVYSFTFWNHDVSIGSVSLSLSFALYPIVFLLKFIEAVLRDSRANVVISVPIYKLTVRKKAIPDILRQLKDESGMEQLIQNRRHNGSLLGFNTQNLAKVAPSPRPGDDGDRGM
eukprot:g5435.t1